MVVVVATGLLLPLAQGREWLLRRPAGHTHHLAHIKPVMVLQERLAVLLQVPLAVPDRLAGAFFLAAVAAAVAQRVLTLRAAAIRRLALCRLLQAGLQDQTPAMQVMSCGFPRHSREDQAADHLTQESAAMVAMVRAAVAAVAAGVAQLAVLAGAAVMGSS